MKKKSLKYDLLAPRPLQRNPWLLILVALVVAGALILPFLLSFNSGDVYAQLAETYRVGELANEDVIARDSFYYIDDDLTERNQNAEAKAVSPYFAYSLSNTLDMYALTDAFTSLLLSHGNAGPSDAVAGEARALLREHDIQHDSGIIERFLALDSQTQTNLLHISKEMISFLLNRGVYAATDINTISSEGYKTIQLENSVSQIYFETPTNVSIDKLVTSSSLDDAVMSFLGGLSDTLSSEHAILLIDTANLLVKENVLYDEIKTLQERQRAVDSVPPVMVDVQRGEYILQKDYVVTEKALKTLKAMAPHTLHYTFLQQMGRLMFALISTVVGISLFYSFLPPTRRRAQYFILLLIGILCTFGAIYGISRMTIPFNFPTVDPLLPVLFLPIFMSLVTSRRRLGVVTAYLLSSYAVLLPSSNILTFFFLMGQSCCCIYFIRFVSRRIDIIFQWFFSCLSCVFVAIICQILLGYPLNGLLLFGGQIINVTVAFILVTVILPIIEWVLNIPTSFRLEELASTDNPTLVRLSRYAQGTYTHSRIVADLAYSAAQTIGANALLAKVGALYHDIGKLDHPEYFIENQSGENKHDEIKPSLSAAIIKSHVKLGVEKGRDAKLPQEVLDIISEHHGNDIIAYFYHEALKQSAEYRHETVKEEDFAYANDPPATQEAAVVMLSDCVEAASRTLKKPTVPQIEKLIHRIIMEKIGHNQLSNSHLSLNDLEAIKKSFVQTLIGQYHSRIEYPDQEEADGK